MRIGKNNNTVGHVPRTISKYITLVILNGGYVYVTITGNPCNPRNNGLEVPCVFCVKGLLKETDLCKQCIFEILKRK